MKKQILITAIIATCTMNIVNSAIAKDGQEGALTITGTVGDASCTVDPSQLTQTVDFNLIPLANVNAAAKYAIVVDSKPVELDVSNCGAEANASVRLNYTSKDTYFIQNTGDAKGVGLVALNKNKKKGDSVVEADVILPGHNAGEVKLASGAAKVKFWIGARQDGAATSRTAGVLSGTVNLTMVYN